MNSFVLASSIVALQCLLAPGLAVAQGTGSPEPVGRDTDAGPDASAQVPVTPLRQIVVRGKRPAEEAREDRAAASSVVTLDRTPRSGESLPQLLGELPGVGVSRLGGLGSAALISLRGSSWEQVLVYLDGVPLNAAVGGGVDLSTVPLGDIERIEVYRGMSPIAFGASALGGIVSVTTRAPARTGASGEAGLGSFGTTHAGGGASWVGDGLKVYAGVHWQRARGDFLYPSNNGTAFDPSDDGDRPRQNNAFHQTDATLRLVAPLSGRRELTLLGSFFQKDQGLAGYGVWSTKVVSLGSLRALGSVAYRSEGDLGANSRVQATAYGVFTQTRFRDPLAEIAYGPAETRDRTRAAGSTWHAQKVIGPVRLGAVLDGRWERFRPADTWQDPPLGPPATRLFGAAGVEAMTAVAPLRLELTPSVRLEVVRDEVAGRTLFQDFVPASDPRTRLHPVVRMAVVQSPTDVLAVKANAGRYARMPNFTELYGDSGFVLGNPDLRPESGWNADLGMTARPRGERFKFAADLFAFGSLVRDLIQYQQGGDGVQRARNIGRARVLGLEGSLRLEYARWLRLLLQGTWTSALDKSDNAAANARQLPLRPTFHGYVRPELRDLPLAAGLTGGIYAEVDATGGNYVDPANIVRMPGRLLVGAGAFLSFPKRYARMILSAQNLTDSRVSDVAGYPLPGCAFFASLAFFTDPAAEPASPAAPSPSQRSDP